MESESKRQVMMCPHWQEACVDGHTKSMGETEDGVIRRCRFWVHVAGKDPQSFKQLDWFDCAIAWMPTLLIENAQMIRHNTASVDKTANIFFEALPAEAKERVAISLTTASGPEVASPDVKQLEGK